MSKTSWYSSAEARGEIINNKMSGCNSIKGERKARKKGAKVSRRKSTWHRAPRANKGREKLAIYHLEWFASVFHLCITVPFTRPHHPRERQDDESWGMNQLLRDFSMGLFPLLLPLFSSFWRADFHLKSLRRAESPSRGESCSRWKPNELKSIAL